MQLELNVYNSCIETDSGLHALPVTQNEQYFNFLVNFLNEHKIFFPCNGRNMDYWPSFRIKISHSDTYTKNQYTVYLKAPDKFNCMIMIFNMLQTVYL